MKEVNKEIVGDILFIEVNKFEYVIKYYFF